MGVPREEEERGRERHRRSEEKRGLNEKSQAQREPEERAGPHGGGTRTRASDAEKSSENREYEEGLEEVVVDTAEPRDDDERKRQRREKACDRARHGAEPPCERAGEKPGRHRKDERRQPHHPRENLHRIAGAEPTRETPRGEIVERRPRTKRSRRSAARIEVQYRRKV